MKPQLAFLIVSLAAARGTNVHEAMSGQLALDREGVDGVGGGDVKQRLFEECESGGVGGRVDRRGNSVS